jgi:hypothetical protein
MDGVQIITVWVDDLLLFTNSPSLMAELKGQLNSILDVTDLGEPKKIVGIEITRDRPKRSIRISQTKYIENILAKQGLQSCNPVKMPLDPAVILEKENTDKDGNRSNSYTSLIGSMMYLAVAMRPDISYAIQRLSSFTANPGLSHWGAAKRVLRYLSGTRDLGVKYHGDHEPNEARIQFVGWTDADFANDPRDRISVSGYVYKLGNGAITWSSKKQNAVSLSSTEAEYAAMAHAAREAVWLRNLFDELSLMQTVPTILYGDNMSALTIARDPQYHARSKHFDVKNHYIRHQIQNQVIKDVYCPTEEMIADILTKPLHKPKHSKFVMQLGMSST